MGKRAEGAQQRCSNRRLHLVFADDQVDWDTALGANNGTVNPLGLYDLDRNIRPVGRAFTALIREWQDMLPAQSVCLLVPVALPSEYDEPYLLRRRDWLKQYRDRRAQANADPS